MRKIILVSNQDSELGGIQSRLLFGESNLKEDSIINSITEKLYCELWIECKIFTQILTAMCSDLKWIYNDNFTHVYW